MTPCPKRCLTIILVELGVEKFGCIGSGPFCRFQVCSGLSISIANILKSLRNLQAIVLKWNQPSHLAATDKKLGLSKLVEELAAGIFKTGSFTAQFFAKILIAAGIIHRPELSDHGFVASGTITFKKMVESVGGLEDSTKGEKQLVINQIVATAARAVGVTTDVADNLFCEMFRKKGSIDKLSKEKKKKGKGRCHDLHAVGQAVYKAERVDCSWRICVYGPGGRIGFVEPFELVAATVETHSKRVKHECWWSGESRPAGECPDSSDDDVPSLKFTQKVQGGPKIKSPYVPAFLQVPKEVDRREFARLWSVSGKETAAMDHFQKTRRNADKSLCVRTMKKPPQLNLESTAAPHGASLSSLWCLYVQKSLENGVANVALYHPLSPTDLRAKYGRENHGLTLLQPQLPCLVSCSVVV